MGGEGGWGRGKTTNCSWESSITSTLLCLKIIHIKVMAEILYNFKDTRIQLLTKVTVFLDRKNHPAARKSICRSSK